MVSRQTPTRNDTATPPGEGLAEFDQDREVVAVAALEVVAVVAALGLAFLHHEAAAEDLAPVAGVGLGQGEAAGGMAAEEGAATGGGLVEQ